MRSFARTIVLSAAVAATPFLIPGSASAAIWTGGTGGKNTTWLTGTNWDTGLAPQNIGDDATFNTKGSIVNPNFTATKSISNVTFNGSGWNIDGYNTINLRGITLSATNATAGISPAVKMDVPFGVSVASGSTLTVSGGFSFNNKDMSKEGLGTAVLNASGNPTVKTISVNAGTLLLTGNHTAGSFATPSLSVGANGTLAGSATVGVPASVSGTISPGNTTVTTGLLTMSGASTFNSGSTLEMQIKGVTAGTDYDQYATNGLTLNTTTGVSDVSLLATLGFDPTVGNAFTLVDNTSASAVVGLFKIGSTTLTEGSTFELTNPNTNKAFRFNLSYVGGTGNDIVATVVPIPEPSTFTMLAMGIASFVACRRRRMA